MTRNARRAVGLTALLLLGTAEEQEKPVSLAPFLPPFLPSVGTSALDGGVLRHYALLYHKCSNWSFNACHHFHPY